MTPCSTAGIISGMASMLQCNAEPIPNTIPAREDLRKWDFPSVYKGSLSSYYTIYVLFPFLSTTTSRGVAHPTADMECNRSLHGMRS